MKKIYHLANCGTCQNIINELSPLPKGTDLQDIKTSSITEEQLNEMHALAGSFEALFSRRALKYRELGLNEQKLTEKDYKKYILKEYTFLKRPVMVFNDQIFIGNAPKVVAAAKAFLSKK